MSDQYGGGGGWGGFLNPDALYAVLRDLVLVRERLGARARDVQPFALVRADEVPVDLGLETCPISTG